MSDNNRRAARKRVYSVTPLQEYLDGLSTPTRGSVHVNGPTHLQAVVTVDFGEPIEHYRLSSDDMQGLVSRMRSLTQDVIGRDAFVSVNSDNKRGVHWASVG